MIFQIFGANYVQDIIYQLDNMGLRDLLLPFILFFTILFAILQKIKIFGTDSKKYNSIIALVISLTIVIPHVLGQYPPDRDVINIINTALPSVALTIVAIVCVLLLIGMFGAGEMEWIASPFTGVITLAAIAIVALIFGNAANWWQIPDMLYFLRDPQLQALLVIVIVFWFVIKMVTSEEKEGHGNENGLANLLTGIANSVNFKKKAK